MNELGRNLLMICEEFENVEGGRQQGDMIAVDLVELVNLLNVELGRGRA